MRYSNPLVTVVISPLRAPATQFRPKSSFARTGVEGDHKDLRSFEAYTDRTGLNRSSTVYRGTRYEYTTLNALNRLFLDLERTGGRGDRGIDLLGSWNLPAFAHPIRVLVSCKSHAKVVQVNWVRELEGLSAGDPRGTNNGRVIGLLVAKGEATIGVRDALARSQLPLGFINVTLEGQVRQMLWNRRVADMGLERVTPKVRIQESENGDDASTIVLMENDKIFDKTYGNIPNP